MLPRRYEQTGWGLPGLLIGVWRPLSTRTIVLVLSWGEDAGKTASQETLKPECNRTLHFKTITVAIVAGLDLEDCLQQFLASPSQEEEAQTCCRRSTARWDEGRKSMETSWKALNPLATAKCHVSSLVFAASWTIKNMCLKSSRSGCVDFSLDILATHRCLLFNVFNSGVQLSSTGWCHWSLSPWDGRRTVSFGTWWRAVASTHLWSRHLAAIPHASHLVICVSHEDDII